LAASLAEPEGAETNNSPFAGEGARLRGVVVHAPFTSVFRVVLPMPGTESVFLLSLFVFLFLFVFTLHFFNFSDSVILLSHVFVCSMWRICGRLCWQLE
jgi:hypothetical protein